MRRFCYTLHLYLGVVAALALIFAGASGAMLVFGNNPTVRAIHVNLFSDFAAVAALVLIPSGIWLWWRSKRLTVRARGFRPATWDLHNAAGFYAAAFLLIVCGTGAVLAFETPIASALHLEMWAMPAAPRVRAPHADVRLDSGTLKARAEHALPGATVVRVDPPRRASSAIAFFMRGPGLFGRSTVYLDPYSGAVLRVDDFRRLPLAYRLHVISRLLHAGDVGGIGGKLVAFLTSIALVIVALTGPAVTIADYFRRRSTSAPSPRPSPPPCRSAAAPAPRAR